jgi:signal transduction histidine kinase
MTVALLLVLVLALAAALGLLLADRRRRAARERGLQHLLGVLGHELRTPLSAVVGYHELLLDGLLGPLPARAHDAVLRIGTSGAQLRHLIDGLSDLMADGRAALDLQLVNGVELAETAAESARALAGGRDVHLQVTIGDGLPVFVTDGTRLVAALDLAIGAAVRASPGATLALSFQGDGDGLCVRVEGTLLDPAREGPENGEGHISTGAGLRLLMARRTLVLLGGELRLEGFRPSAVVLRVPSAPIDHPAAPE